MESFIYTDIRSQERIPGNVELRPGDLFDQGRQPGAGPVVCGVEIVGPVGVSVGEVCDDREAPIPVAQAKIAADRKAERAGTIESAEIVLNVSDLGGIMAWLELYEHHIADHGATVAAARSSRNGHVADEFLVARRRIPHGFSRLRTPALGHASMVAHY